MGDQRVLHGDRGQDRADQHDRREQATVEHAHRGRGRRPGLPRLLSLLRELSLLRDRRRAALAHQSDHYDDGADQAGDEGQPDPDGPERRVQHKTTFPLFDFTRFGLAAQ